MTKAFDWSAPVETLSGVGPRVAEKLGRLGLETLEDLAFHLPLRYQDRTRSVPMGSLRPGDEVVVIGVIQHSGVAYGRRRSLLTRISDGTGALTIRLFHFSAAQQRHLRKGRWVMCFGEVRPGPSTLEMVHPEYRVRDHEPVLDPGSGLTPIYPTTEGLGQGQLRRLMDQALAGHLRDLPDWIPPGVLNGSLRVSLAQALAYLHHPPADADMAKLRDGGTPQQQRLAFEELLVHHLSLRRARLRRRTARAPRLNVEHGHARALIRGLPFSLTGAQRRVVAEIGRDMSGEQPMLRLVQGDVGSGKTVVAAVAAAAAAQAGWQTALMAPTELLSEQHFDNFCQWLSPLGIRVIQLSGKSSAARRRQALQQLQSGDAEVAIGTHALFQTDVAFHRLGLVVVDEQHRFGVGQRLALHDKGRGEDQAPHQLIMTATPIPRTLAMTFYADLDVSSIDELPPGRQPVETVAVRDERRDEVVQRVREACRSGRQAYWVCPFVEESDAIDASAATSMARDLSEALPEVEVGLIHGRMKAADKDAMMRRFRDGGVQLLVATTVIEVGVDVPNASLMIIENAERLGLSQLHQLRGRVGRGSQHSACVLMYKTPLGEHARVRLAAMRETNDGFELAQRDLELRGPGEVLGTRQTGLQRLRVADLARDRALLPEVQSAGQIMLDDYPDRIDPLIRRWLSRHEEYAHV
ncbi:MAG TPA: ATP-dependent DNA helicase RecG [Arenicellales bacterium]|nr:ATP-dependent DNA helicase RecG [Arenicellales bacterium]